MECIKYLYIIAAVLIASYAAASSGEPVTVVPIDQDGIQRVEIEGGSYFFKPDHIVVRINIPVELKVSKESGLIPHNIVAISREAGIAFQENLSSTPKSIRLTPTKVGTYPIYCSKKAPFSKSHREKGMEGVIEVVP